MNKPALKTGRASDERKVDIGELSVLQTTGVLKTLLGSCIGLVLYDRRNCVGGLAHIVLPSANGSSASPGKYADTALPELMRLIEQMGGKSKNLTAKMAGGANMFVTSATNGIGAQNVSMVESLLKYTGIPVLGRDCGGQHGRRMAFNVQTGNVTVEIVGGQPVQL